MIKDLDISFKNEKETIRVANFINKVKWQILIDNPENRWLFQWSIWWDLEVNNGYLFDTNILKADTIDKSYNSIKDQEAFIEYLNSL
jgi:hypothetical protein